VNIASFRRSRVLPNFLIVGAARSGTTSLYNYLKQHPEIYMSPVKEPKFITAQFLRFPLNGIGDGEIERNMVKSFDEYNKLFENVRHEKAIGEASADYLYYFENSIKYIKEFLGEVKIIIVLRNPVERAFSNYLYLFKEGRERLSFEDALKSESERKRLNWEYMWFYKDVGFYYQQVKAYLKSFQKVGIFLYDDLRNDASTLMKSMFNFLDAQTSFSPQMDVTYNASGIPKNRLVYNFLTKSNFFKAALKPVMDSVLPVKRRSHTIEKIKTHSLRKPSLLPQPREFLKNIYREDILRLQALIKRDLSHWLV